MHLSCLSASIRHKVLWNSCILRERAADPCTLAKLKMLLTRQATIPSSVTRTCRHVLHSNQQQLRCRTPVVRASSGDAEAGISYEDACKILGVDERNTGFEYILEAKNKMLAKNKGDKDKTAQVGAPGPRILLWLGVLWIAHAWNGSSHVISRLPSSSCMQLPLICHHASVQQQPC